MKTCRRCGEAKPLADYYRNRVMRDGALNTCKPCVLAQQHEYRRQSPVSRAYNLARGRTPERQARRKDYWASRRASDLTEYRRRVAANSAVAYALRTGRLTKPEQCEGCARPGPLEGAHADYDRKLDVRWLCHPCHGAWDHHEPKK